MKEGDTFIMTQEILDKKAKSRYYYTTSFTIGKKYTVYNETIIDNVIYYNVTADDYGSYIFSKECFNSINPLMYEILH